MSAGRLLITGFGPFPGVRDNPSAALARRLGAMPRLRSLAGGSPRILILPTTHAGIEAVLAPALAEGPGAVLMIGVARRARRIRVESRACNRVSPLFPDAAGRVSGGITLEREGPPARRSPVAAQALAILRRRGVDAAISQDAGRYLCNTAYFRALRETRRVLFLHIPPVPDPARRCVSSRLRHRSAGEAVAQAVADVAEFLARPR